MRTSRFWPTSLIFRTYAGFLIGILAIPLLNHLTRIPPEELTLAHYESAPRELQASWLLSGAATEANDRVVLVGTSIIGAGFAFEGSDNASRLWIPRMRIDQAIQITQSLIARKQPPKVILVDWAALGEHDQPEAEDVRVLPTFTISTFAFQIVSLFGESSEAGKGPWKAGRPLKSYSAKRTKPFLASIDHLAPLAKYDRFLREIEADCQNAHASISIVRFPLYLTRDSYAELVRLSEPGYAEILHSRSRASSCDIRFIDLFEEGMEKFRTQSQNSHPKDYWFDINHFNSKLGEQLLADPRLRIPDYAFEAGS